MVHFAQIISAAALVSVSSAVPMARRYAPSASSSAYSAYSTGTYQAASSNMDSSYGSGYDSSYGSVDSSYSSGSDSSYGSMDSSYGSADSSYGSSDSSYGSMDSSYGSADSSYGGSWNSASTETMMDVMTSTYSSSSSVETMMDAMTSTYSSYTPAQTSSAMSTEVTYGSGSSSWGGSSSSGYDSCVQQCQAQFGAPPPTVTTPPSEEVSGTSTSSGGGATHTIIVAPSQGVLRYVPFATNASVGDTVTFHWLAGPHTVTQSSAAEVCNKTANGFASGMQNAGALFNQMINDTNPIWFYCGVPGHCEKGMFGGINIGNPQQTPSSNSTYMPMSSVLTDMAQNPEISSAWNYTKSVVGSNSSLSNWGMDINCAGMDDSTKSTALLNVLYSQAVMAMNPEVFQGGKVVNATASLKLPQTFATQTNTTQTDGGSSSDSATAPSSNTTNGVESLLAPRYLMAIVVALASLAIF